MPASCKLKLTQLQCCLRWIWQLVSCSCWHGTVPMQQRRNGPQTQPVLLAGTSMSHSFFTAPFRDFGCSSNAAVMFCSLGLGQFYPGIKQLPDVCIKSDVSQCILEYLCWMLGYCPRFRNHNSCYLIQPFLPPCWFQRGWATCGLGQATPSQSQAIC